eukprot:TRINITY_DN1354_c0_g2_i3.p1 TRINITY_DN1354_c0_g2~~TRINITY_DN1354_c0_g2_i3.p1  ORF type:complete len:334 (-),score=32.06 TRINITY_DN1354_c0_g2_i3:1283-2284(-)
MVESMMLSELVLPNLSVTSECLFSVGYTYPDVTENDTYIRVDSSIYTVETDPLAKILFNTHKLRVATSNPQQTSSLLKPVLQKLNDHYKTNVSAYYLNVPPSDFFSQLDNGAVDMICDLSWENLMTLYTNKPAQDYRTTCPEMGYSLQVVSNIPGVKTTEELYKQINEMLMLNYLVQSCDVSKETSYFLNIYFPGIKLISMQECEKAFNESMIPTVAPFKAGSMDEETLKNILSGKLRLSTGLVLPISSIFPKEEPYPENTVSLPHFPFSLFPFAWAEPSRSGWHKLLGGNTPGLVLGVSLHNSPFFPSCTTHPFSHCHIFWGFVILSHLLFN